MARKINVHDRIKGFDFEEKDHEPVEFEWLGATFISRKHVPIQVARSFAALNDPKASDLDKTDALISGLKHLLEREYHPLLDRVVEEEGPSFIEVYKTFLGLVQALNEPTPLESSKSASRSTKRTKKPSTVTASGTDFPDGVG